MTFNGINRLCPSRACGKNKNGCARLGGEVFFAVSDDSSDDGFFLDKDHIHSEVSALYDWSQKRPC